MLATALPRVVALCLLVLAAGCPDSDSDPPTEWSPLGNEVDSAPPPEFDLYYPSVAMDPSTDRPVVSLNEKIDNFESVIRVKAWSGTAWEELAPTPGVENPRSSAIAVASDGTVWLAWTEYDVNPALGQHLHVARWTGAAWDRVATDLAVDAHEARAWTSG